MITAFRDGICSTDASFVKMPVERLSDPSYVFYPTFRISSDGMDSYACMYCPSNWSTDDLSYHYKLYPAISLAIQYKPY